MADNDTLKFLDEVKKGKARKFVMICRGVKILSLIVYKKGTLEKYKKQAKEEGKGQFYHGVVDGKGQNIVFKLCRDEGFDQPPGKELILKDYLQSTLGMKFKPVYAIVDQLPTVDESDDETDFAEEASSEPQDVSAFEDELKKLAPTIKSYLAENPDKRVEILKPTKLVKDYVADPEAVDIKDAEAALTSIKNLLGDAASVAPPAPDDNALKFVQLAKRLVPDAKALAGSTDVRAEEAAALLKQVAAAKANGDMAAGVEALKSIARLCADKPAAQQQFETLVKEVVPQAKHVAQSEDPRAGQFTELLKAVAAARKEGDFDTGLNEVKALQQLLQTPVASTADQQRETFEDYLKDLAPQALPIAKSDAPHAKAIAELLRAIQVDRKSKRFEAGLEKLHQLSELVTEAKGADRVADATPNLTVPQRAIAHWRLQWSNVRRAIELELGKLYDSIPDLLHQEDASMLQTAIGAKIGEIETNLSTQLEDAFDDLLKAEPDDQEGAYKQVTSVATDLLGFVDSNELLDMLDDYPFGVDIAVADRLKATLNEIATGSANAASSL